MIPYIRCPSCGFLLTQNYAKYCEEVIAISDDPNKTEDLKKTLHSELLDKYGYVNICCRARILGTLRYHEIIVT